MDKTRVVLGVVAVAVIIFSGVMIISNFVSLTPVKTEETHFYMLKCTNAECGEVFRRSAAELRSGVSEDKGFSMMESSVRPGSTCPKCGQQSGYIATRCKNCKAWFVPEFFYNSGAKRRIPTCPECGWKTGGKRTARRRK